MGFKKISFKDLEISDGPNLVGMPIIKNIQFKNIEKSDNNQVGTSETGNRVIICNEEILNFVYQDNGRKKSFEGYGNLIIMNNSQRDRIWDSKIRFRSSDICNLEKENVVNLGIFEPSSKKVIKYDIEPSNNLSDILKINEYIDIKNDKIEKLFNLRQEKEESLENRDEGLSPFYILVLGKENIVNYKIQLTNVTSSIIESIKLNKIVSNDFFDIEITENARVSNFIKENNNIEWHISALNPNEGITINFKAKIIPIKQERIKTGSIKVSCSRKDKLLSDIEIEEFSAFSHALHAINKAEIHNKPDNWMCSVIFENHSDFVIALKNIIVSDIDMKKRFLEVNFNEQEQKLLFPGESYTSEEWELESSIDPTFSRKVEYSVGYKFDKNSIINLSSDDQFFNIINFNIEKEDTQNTLQSFKESKFEQKIKINNLSTIPIDALLIRQRIPDDFLPLKDKSEYKFSEKVELDDITIEISPDDDDSSHAHYLDLKLNLGNTNQKSILNINESLVVKHPIKAISPSHEKDYIFPLEIKAYFKKYQNNSQNDDFYVITEILSEDHQTKLDIIHKRRNLWIGKEIFPGKEDDEFAINIQVHNNSNVKIESLNISDIFPESFELISSSSEHKLSKMGKDKTQKISFFIDSLLPYQEHEITYYIKNNNGNEMSYTELESYFIG